METHGIFIPVSFRVVSAFTSHNPFPDDARTVFSFFGPAANNSWYLKEYPLAKTIRFVEKRFPQTGLSRKKYAKISSYGENHTA